MISISTSINFVPASDPEEIAFALCLFVEFVEGRLTPAPGRTLQTSRMDLNTGEPEFLWTSPAEKALAAICEFYGEDPARGDICARVAAFYLLLSRSDAAAFANWIPEASDGSGNTTLSSELIHAIATIPLCKQIPYDADSLLQYLQRNAEMQAMNDRWVQVS